MKFIHLSDLHIGKILCGFSFIDDQKHILDQIVSIVKEVKPDGILIAGDIYDKGNPSAEAVTLFDGFITKLSEEKIPIYIISGNHDSAERLSYGSELFKKSKVYLSQVYNGSLEKITMSDSFGRVNVYLMPFVRPVHVRRFYPEGNAETVDKAVRTVLTNTEINENDRNILLCHQFVAGATVGDSEESNVGTLDNVCADAFDSFDYVALGHIHGPQKITKDTIRYCGTPLKYSMSEEKHHKSLTVVELLEKGNVKISTIPLKPLRDMRRIKGLYSDIVSYENYSKGSTDDYVQVVLTDENDIQNGMEKLRIVYPKILSLEYDNKRTQNTRRLVADKRVQERTPTDLFQQHFQTMNNREMNDEESAFVEKLIEEIWGENE